MIRTRLTLWNTVVLAVVLTFLGAVVFFGTRASLYGAVSEELVRRGDFLDRNWRYLSKKPPAAVMPVPKPDPAIDPSQFRDIEFESLIARPRIQRLGIESRLQEEGPWDSAAMRRSLSGERLLFDSTIDGRRVRLLSLPLREKGRVTGAAQFAASLKSADGAVFRLGRTLLVLLPLALVATSLTGVWLTRRALRPVGDIVSAAERIEATNLSGRLDVRGNDEFGHLASVFNAMLDRLESAFRKLEDSFESQRRFIADASHELKTPLTAIKTRLGVAKRQAHTPERVGENLASLERSANAMSAIVSDLLLLARADDGRLGSSARVLPIDSLADEAAAVVEDASGREITVEAESGLTVKGEESGLSRVLVNLLDNAARHTPPDATIRLEAVRVEDHIRIRIIDTGSGIPEADLPHVFDRFYRVSEARDRESGGMGLGLAIVRSIVTAHGGQVHIESEIGAGTTVTVELPAA